MSYFVKGGTPPKSCGNCPHNYSSLKCKITNSEIDRDEEYRERLSDCPIVEVKEPHGRLGDLEELKTAFPRCDNSMDIKIASVRATINHAPTVIEGSETDA